ncbi:secretion protein HylD [Vibrio breoganii]|uniref:Membrane fusion protein (MFP) family protein n=1 Tax=Vibrio breoganii TaxID=553239 RepID=A0ABX1U8F9_9VIBR|nr:HlyD family type I secretion periplasmic adaptor subunit [Vibrio breoganii]NMO73222.1 HlyD family type I secretion periplasmic adaptor subunit [Vibrio breoganii]NMR69514.1 HlyD family type I secretion periplasmic adaptor subunit [Vibrio breoganii]PMG02131.1 secretion protein HylD [Vibrio breoganii]PML90261.1 secretion protein HylD [Vibrio breoganii]
MKSSTVEVIESGITRRLLTISTLLIGACIVLFIGWTVFTKVDEIAKAKGAVIPEGERQVIQSELGGKLKTIFVKRGQLVEIGDSIVEFDATFQTSALEELNSKEATLKLSIERMTALIEEREPDFTQYETQYPEVVAEQRAELAATKSLYFKKRVVLEKESERIAEELNGVDRQIPSEVRQLRSSQKELNILIKGQKSGSISQVRVLEMRQKIASIETELEQAKAKKAVLIKQAESNQSKIEQLLAEAKLEVSKERSKAVSELSALNARLRSGEAKVSNTLVTSPVKGLVQSLPTTRSGGVIKPGGTVVEIVPVDGRAAFKAKLSPRDVGFVSVGQPARVKVDAFDYSRFGALKGTVTEISPTTSQTNRGEIYYDVFVQVEKGYFGNDPARFTIIPGMTGEVDITTGEKTVFQYLWKPIYTNVSRAFGER